MNIKGKKGQEFFDDAQKMADYFAKNKITEESDFNNLDNAKKHLEDMKKKGHKGIISKGGKPVKEETILERIDRKLKERKNG